ncbi:MAG: hypothetical protein ACP5QK_12120 [Myxococcota bacterium]
MNSKVRDLRTARAKWYGKTTILHILTGLTTPSENKIIFLSKDISDRDSWSDILRRMNSSSTYTAPHICPK